MNQMNNALLGTQKSFLRMEIKIRHNNIDHQQYAHDHTEPRDNGNASTNECTWHDTVQYKSNPVLVRENGCSRSSRSWSR